VPVTVKNLYGREFTGNMFVTHYKPRGAGPFPFVVMSHGRGPNRQESVRQRFVDVARFWIARGYAVFVPTRLGYGATTGPDVDLEDSGPCNKKNYVPMMEAATEQVLLTIEFAKKQAWVDPKGIILMGQSVGGFTTVAAGGTAEFVSLPASGEDGHLALAREMSTWHPRVDEWLKSFKSK
jgi:dienelactone hydrolase